MDSIELIEAMEEKVAAMSKEKGKVANGCYASMSRVRRLTLDVAKIGKEFRERTLLEEKHKKSSISK